jgi:hypothetical protein
MDTNKSTFYGNQFKAKIALKALKGTPLPKLSKEYEVPVSEIQ